jgi:hypothetical protein
MAKTGPSLSINLSAIVYCEDSTWIAHCLELDIVAEGHDADDAVTSLVSLCDLQIRTAMEHGDLGSIFRPAPPEIWAMFAGGTGITTKKMKRFRRSDRFKAPVDRFEARQMAMA